MIHISDRSNARPSWEWQPCMRTAVEQKAVLMTESFAVETQHGTMVGRAGDYLMEGVTGDLYVVSGDAYARCYRLLAPAGP